VNMHQRLEMIAALPVSEEVAALPASVEALPKVILKEDALGQLFPKGTWVYLPDTGVDDTSAFVRAAKKLTDQGFEPVIHLPVRRFATLHAAEERMRELNQEAGVENALAIGGEADKAGVFNSVREFLETGLLDRCGFKRVGIAGHPEGNSAYNHQSPYDILRSKIALAQKSDAEFRIVTQFGFDADVFVKWATNLPQEGIDLPVHLGISGPVKLPTLIKYSTMCGVGNSLQFLMRKASSVASLALGFDPEEMAHEVEQMNVESNSPISQFHVFAFGSLKKTSEWLYQRGSWGN